MHMLLRFAIGQVVRRHRRDRAKTLQQLSTEARVSLPYISEIERGRKEVSSEILATLCRALEVPMDAFLREVSVALAEESTGNESTGNATASTAAASSGAGSVVVLDRIRARHTATQTSSAAVSSTPVRSIPIPVRSTDVKLAA
jgi:transcriptional regulator with XRE-family HTH domain